MTPWYKTLLTQALTVLGKDVYVHVWVLVFIGSAAFIAGRLL